MKRVLFNFAPLGMARGRQSASCRQSGWILLLAAATFFFLAGSLAGGGNQPKKRININAATVEELATLPGIGPVIAQRIVAHREKNGAFRRVEELLIIRGISRKKFEKIKPLITTEAKEAKERKSD